MTFFDPFYQALASLGFTDPLHPPFTHMPIGLVVASLIFGFGALLLRRPFLGLSARHCLVLAWLFIFPTVLMGFMDWQHYYRGAWLLPIIIKIFLAAWLLVLLTLGVMLISRGQGESRVLLVIYVLSFLTVVGLGYYGGRLVYGGRSQAGGEAFQAGKKIFEISCQACHPNGGNTVMPKYPLTGSDRLGDFKTFFGFLRDPRLDNGSKGSMPTFGPEQISEQQAGELYRYLIQAFGGPPSGTKNPHKP